MDRHAIARAFAAAYGTAPTLLARAPGRVNLIGEHTDYNEGFVLPVAISRAVWIAARPRADRQVRLFSLNFDQRVTFSLDTLAPDASAPWSSYIRGVAWALQAEGYRLRGFDGVVWGDVPIGAGLSSSAAIEVAAARLFVAVSDLDLDPVRLALLCQRAENEFVGVRCGIMDQFIATLGRRHHALLIDCRDLSYRPVPVQPAAAVVVADTLVRRGLVASEYNQRRAECEEAVRRLQAVLPGIRALRDVTSADLERYGTLLPAVIWRRARHVVTENERTLEGARRLEQGDLVGFGQLMFASHASLRDDYAVSCPELDAMVEAAREQPGLYGARMTGAGFGGCTVNLVAAGRVAEFCQGLMAAYARRTGQVPQVYACTVDDGATVEPWA